MSQRPPTGLILNPIYANKLAVKYDDTGSIVQRSVVGKVKMFQDMRIKRDMTTLGQKKKMKKKRYTNNTNLKTNSQRSSQVSMYSSKSRSPGNSPMRFKDGSGKRMGSNSFLKNNSLVSPLGPRGFGDNFKSPQPHRQSSGLMVKEWIKHPGMKTKLNRSSPQGPK